MASYNVSCRSCQNSTFRCLLPWMICLIMVMLFQLNTFMSRDITKNASSGNSIREPAPIQLLLLTYVRSGSTFVGELLSGIPSSFYYYEPLYFLRKSMRNESAVNEKQSLLDAQQIVDAQKYLKQVFRCNVSAKEDILDLQKENAVSLLKRSAQYWSECSKVHRGKNSVINCLSTTYMNNYCAEKQNIVIKTVRLKLREAVSLLQDPDLSLKIIYLVRDPRGTYNSRNKYPIRTWCQKLLHCYSYTHFCSSLVDDTEVICQLQKENPNNFLVVRYEDIAKYPFLETERIFQFLGFSNIPEKVYRFLNTHTLIKGKKKKRNRKFKAKNPYGTFRNSSAAASSWRMELNFSHMAKVQKHCEPVLNFFGYYYYSTLATMQSNIDFDLSLHSALQYGCSNYSAAG